MNTENNVAVSAGAAGETGPGRAAVLLPLIIGGALAAAGLIFWDAHRTKVLSAAVTQIEEASRQDIHNAYRELRAAQPEAALALASSAETKLRDLKNLLPADYAELRMELLIIQGEAAFMLGILDRAGEAEEKFDQALALMISPSGPIWEKGMFGRARARLEQGKDPQAEEDLSKILDTNPNFGTAYYWRSVVRSRMGNVEGAAEDAAHARRLGSWPPIRDFVIRRGE